jgi:hypothetical protein
VSNLSFERERNSPLKIIIFSNCPMQVLHGDARVPSWLFVLILIEHRQTDIPLGQDRRNKSGKARFLTAQLCKPANQCIHLFKRFRT